MDVDSHISVAVVEYFRPASDTRPDTVVVVPGHYHLRTIMQQVSTEKHRDAEVKLSLSVAFVGLRASGVAGFPFAAVPDQFIDVRRITSIQAVMTWVDTNDHSCQDSRRHRCRNLG